MIQSIHIQNFKSVENQVFDFKPLTIFTGANSSGKSSVIQAILLYSNYVNNSMLLDNYIDSWGEFRDLIYKHSNSKNFSITPTIAESNTKKLKLIFDKETDTLTLDYIRGKKMIAQSLNNTFPIFEKEIYYISANRIGQENQSSVKEKFKCGVNGEYIFGFYSSHKNNKLYNQKLIKTEATSQTLNAQVNYWLNKILKLNLLPITYAIDKANVKIVYQNFDLDSVNGIEMSPFNLGAGVSYLTKILILGLSLKEGDILIVENPEVHLHPNAIADFTEFFEFLAKGGIQVILETHSEHIINKMRYFVFKGRLSTDDVQIYYREKFDKEFIAIRINKDGRYIDNKDNVINFPSGFFDSVLKDLLEMF